MVKKRVKVYGKIYKVYLSICNCVVLGFSVCKKEDSNIYAIELDDKINLLIENKDIQKN